MHGGDVISGAGAHVSSRRDDPGRASGGIDRLEGRTRHVVEIAALLIGGFFVAFFAYYATLLTYDSWRFHDMAQGVLPVPLWIPQLGYSGGLLILLVAFIDELIHVVRGNPPRYEKPKPKTAEEVVEQAIQSGV